MPELTFRPITTELTFVPIFCPNCKMRLSPIFTPIVVDTHISIVSFVVSEGGDVGVPDGTWGAGCCVDRFAGKIIHEPTLGKNAAPNGMEMLADPCRRPAMELP